MKLYFSRNPNPRLAMAVARYLNSDIAFQLASPRDPARGHEYLHLNPNLLLPILEGPPRPLWEADAIACFLSRRAGATFWRTDDDEPEMIRWISWGKENFGRSCETVVWERATKPRYGIGDCDEAAVEGGLAQFHESARILDAALAGREWLVGDAISYADFRMATFLPFNDDVGLPIGDYQEISRWYAQLEAFEGWADPFVGLDVPALPPVPR
jgi:glutathione S-transferase